MKTDEQLLEGIVNGTLDDSDKKEVKYRYEHSESFKKAFIEASIMMASLESLGDADNEEQDVSSFHNRKRLRVVLTRIAGVAAVLLIAFVLVYPKHGKPSVEETLLSLYNYQDAMETSSLLMDTSAIIKDAQETYNKAQQSAAKSEMHSYFLASAELYEKAYWSYQGLRQYDLVYRAANAYFYAEQFEDAYRLYTYLFNNKENLSTDDVAIAALRILLIDSRHSGDAQMPDEVQAYLNTHKSTLAKYLNEEQMVLVDQFID